MGRDATPALVGVVTVGLLGAALIASSAGQPEWAAEAEEYVAALHTAYDTGFANVAQFYAEDARANQSTFTGGLGTDRAGLAHNMRQGCEFPWDADPTDRFHVTVEEPVYVSLNGAIDPMRWQATCMPDLSVAPVFAISSDGIVEVTWTGAAHAAHYVGYDRESIDPIAVNYVDAWSSGDPTTVWDRYAPDAVVRDSISHLLLRGRAEIAAVANSTFARGAMPGVSLRHLPLESRAGGDACYFNFVDDSLDRRGVGSTGPRDIVEAGHRMVLLLDVPDDNGCTRQVGTLLWLESGSITREERFHRVDALRRCADPDEFPAGWWDVVPAPDPTAFTRTGTLDALNRPIALWNATPAREDLLRWALQRFSDVGLSPPLPTSVTFVPFGDDPWSRFGFVPGTADVVLPDTADGCPAGGCTSWSTAAHALALKELATSWVAEFSHQWPLAEFASQEGLTWDREDVEASRELIDLAAQTITWGLMDEPYDLDPSLRSRTCAQISGDFEALTLAVPTGLACPAVARRTPTVVRP